MAKQTSNLGKRWYAIHTYSGYEENVVRNLKQRIESMDMEDTIYNVLIPTERKIKIKNGKRKTVVEKIFPGYVLVEMIVTDDSWYVVRNTPNVTGLNGRGNASYTITKFAALNGSNPDVPRMQIYWLNSWCIWRL